MAINQALEVASKTQAEAVPLQLRNAPTSLMKELGYSDGYKYSHDYPGHFVDQEFMPDGLRGTVFYQPAMKTDSNHILSHAGQSIIKNRIFPARQIRTDIRLRNAQRSHRSGTILRGRPIFDQALWTDF